MWSFWADLALAAEPSEVGYVGADTVVTAHLAAPLPLGASVRVTPGGRGDRARLGVAVFSGLRF
ncbi:MAG: hypothetical protein ABMA64_24290 [Myxococcota bacterium]